MARRVHSRSAPSSIADILRAAGDRAKMENREQKKNYAESLSRSLATVVASSLRKDFDGILPDAAGGKQESPARSARGFKKLDVNYSKSEIGLGLGVSIKTINFPDARTKRYTKNYSRVDNELRAEAHDYHERQPFAVLVALIFMPVNACDDGGSDPSSFGAAVQYFRLRGGRVAPKNSEMKFEGVFLGLYDTDDGAFGNVVFFDVRDRPPKSGRPKKTLSFTEVVERIVEIYDARNNPPAEWA